MTTLVIPITKQNQTRTWKESKQKPKKGTITMIIPVLMKVQMKTLNQMLLKVTLLKNTTATIATLVQTRNLDQEVIVRRKKRNPKKRRKKRANQQKLSQKSLVRSATPRKKMPINQNELQQHS